MTKRMGRPRSQPAKSPADARVSAAVQATLAEHGISQAELRERIVARTGSPVGAWVVSRWVRGLVHLTQPLRLDVQPSDTLRTLAAAVDPENADRLARQWASHAQEGAQS